MERVDVVIVGQGVVALAAAARAAQEGVRAILVDRGPRLAESAALLRARADALPRLGLDPSAAEGTIAAEQVIASAALGAALERRARVAGVEIRNAAQRAVEVRLDASGWRVAVAGGEPIRAPLFVLADDARAPLLGELGLAQATRMTRDGAEIATFVAATWLLPPSELAKHETAWVRAGTARLARTELLTGRDRVTLRVGPVWAVDAPAIDHPAVIDAVTRAATRVGLPATAPSRIIELEEVRLDALPCPMTFDAGMVIGFGAGHAPRAPGGGVDVAFDFGEAAGRAAARSVLAEDLSAAALSRALGDDYRSLFDRTQLPPVAAPQPWHAGMDGRRG